MRLFVATNYERPTYFLFYTMSKNFLVTVAVTNYYEMIVHAPNEEVLEKFRDPDFARHIEGDGLEKILHPEWHRSPDKREVALVDIIEGI